MIPDHDRHHDEQQNVQDEANARMEVEHEDGCHVEEPCRECYLCDIAADEWKR